MLCYVTKLHTECMKAVDEAHAFTLAVVGRTA